MSDTAITHSASFIRRRFLNWFPLGLSYAFLYMGRYNLTVAKNSLGELMTKEDFGIIFGAGTACYALAFLINGPLVDRIGGRKGMLIGVMGSLLANLVMGLYLRHALLAGNMSHTELRWIFSALYAGNMYFQSYGAVSIVKVNASWFHVRERGGFSGIFGTMISSGIFFAFTVNKWILDAASKVFKGPSQYVVFVAPAVLLAIMWGIELFVLRDRPSLAGHEDFDTGDASSGDESDEPLATGELFKRIFTNPIIMTVAAIEFCTGILRNGIMHWFPIYVKEVWVLPAKHHLMYGSWEYIWLVVVMFVVAAISGYMASRSTGNMRGVLIVLAVLAFLVPFFQAGWGGLLFAAGVIGGNAAGWVSQLFFQSRRAPAAGGLYVILTLCTIAMTWALAKPGTEVGWSKAASQAQKDGRPQDDDAAYLLPGDELIAIATTPVKGWADVRNVVACIAPTKCIHSQWNADRCVCSSSAKAGARMGNGIIEVQLKRAGQVRTIALADPAPEQQGGAKRKLAARPVLPITPYFLGALVFLMSLCVIGTHGLLSGTATMDFGGRKGAATAVGVIDGFVYAGTAVQSISLGYLTTRDWSYWPLFLIPFALIGTLLTTRIWNAKPGGATH